MTAVWRKSSYSAGGGTTDCVELASLADSIGVRDSKNPSWGHLVIEAAAFRLFLQKAKFGTFGR